MVGGRTGGTTHLYFCLTTRTAIAVENNALPMTPKDTQTDESGGNNNINNLFYALRISDTTCAFVVVSLSSTQSKSQIQKQVSARMMKSNEEKVFAVNFTCTHTTPQFKAFSRLCHDFLRSFEEYIKISRIWNPRSVAGFGGRERSSTSSATTSGPAGEDLLPPAVDRTGSTGHRDSFGGR